MIKQKRSKNQKEIMDRVLPVFMVCVVLPLIVRLHVYTEDLEECSWFGFDTYFTDFFNYSKSIVFYIIVVWMLAKLLWEWLQGRRVLTGSPYLLLFGVIFAFYLISAFLAKDTSLSWGGGYQSFQGTFVLIGYFVLCAYAYGRMDRDACIVVFYRSNVCISVISCIIGFLQLIGQDPFFWNPVQRLIIPGAYAGATLERELRANTVYLTMGNPNYASIFLAAQIILISIFLITNQNQTKKILLGLLDLGLLVCVWFTYSRVGLAMLFAAAFAAILLCRRQWKMNRRRLLLTGIAIALGLLALDAATGLRFAERLRGTVQSFTQERKNCEIDDLRTESDGIYFAQNGIRLRMYIVGEFAQNENIRFETSDGTDITNFYEEDTNVLAYEGLEEVSAFIDTIDGEPMLVLKIAETCFRFVKEESDGYLLYVGNGHYDTVRPVESFGFSGMEHIASGRLYLWSRTLPLLKSNWLLGCGADNFFLVYPQHDYVGKAQYCSDPLTIVERPHSAYLKLAVEQGMIPFVLLMAAYGSFMRREWCYFRKTADYTARQWLVLGCFLVSIAYMAAFLFNDWNINVMPLFWVAVGIAAGSSTGA